MEVFTTSPHEAPEDEESYWTLLQLPTAGLSRALCWEGNTELCFFGPRKNAGEWQVRKPEGSIS